LREPLGGSVGILFGARVCGCELAFDCRGIGVYLLGNDMRAIICVTFGHWRQHDGPSPCAGRTLGLGGGDEDDGFGGDFYADLVAEAEDAGFAGRGELDLDR
jgi:hypothetical protein